jgi:phage tail sheath gpL-like
MSGGAGDPDLSATIAAMGDEPFDYIGLPFSDSASLQLMATEMNDSSGRWSYIRQLYGTYTARTGSLSELVAYGDTFNYQHITIAGYERMCRRRLMSWWHIVWRVRLYFYAMIPRADADRELTGALPAPTGKRFNLTEQQSLLTHGIATAYTESGICAFSATSPPTGKTLTAWRITAIWTAKRCIPARTCCVA